MYIHIGHTINALLDVCILIGVEIDMINTQLGVLFLVSFEQPSAWCPLSPQL